MEQSKWYNSAIQVQFQDKTICISLHINAFEKGMNPSSLPPISSKQNSKADS